MLCGADRLWSGDFTALRRRLRSSRVGVLVHAASIDFRGRHLLAMLDELGIAPRLIFAPEHGLGGAAQAEQPVGDETVNGTPVVSLYGQSKATLSPTPEELAEIDLLLIDLADVGSRYYTYVWSALLAARAAQAAGIHSVVLDRPNPLSGDPVSVEGVPQQAGFLSFVGLEAIPIRHALSIGELLAHFFERDGLPLGSGGALSVVPTLGWERHRTAEAWGRPFVMPSPNMPTLETALVYPGGCLLEGTNLSEGRGTTAPFQIVGAPFLDGEALARSLDSTSPGVLVRPVRFCPSFDKFAGVQCQGVMLHVREPALFRPVATYLRLIALCRAQAPEQFAFRRTPYEFETEHPAFDLLTGSEAARAALEAGASPEDVAGLVAPVPGEFRELVLAAEARLDRAAA